MRRLFEYIKGIQARTLKRETHALYLAGRDPRTPWPAKVIIAVVVACALSPIDLIPDFIPVLGYLDDVLLYRSASISRSSLSPPRTDARHAAQSSERQFAGKPRRSRRHYPTLNDQRDRCLSICAWLV